MAGVFGDRVCDYRFDDYELRKFIKPTDRVLDIGCNCGFMALLAGYRIGYQTTGVDVNPYMTEIGELVADYLRISDVSTLISGRIQEYSPVEKFDVVMSFATHWIDDENYRVGVVQHMRTMAEFIVTGGTLIFETHCNDVGVGDFYEAMEESRFFLILILIIKNRFRYSRTLHYEKKVG